MAVLSPAMAYVAEMAALAVAARFGCEKAPKLAAKVT